MPSSPFKRLLLAILLAATAAALLLQSINSQFKTPPTPLPNPKSEAHFQAPPLAPKVSAQTEAPEESEIEAVVLPRISRDQAEAWLTSHNRNAASLLAVFRAMDDTNYLNEAAANFPNDPHVELAVLARDAFPADRRKWLDLFKTSSPSNSLANYFSAADHFKNGKTEEAVQELLAASEKAQFQNHGVEIQLSAEELYLDSGKSSGEAASLALADMCAENLPGLTMIKRMDQGIQELIKQKMAAGDADSAISLAQMGMIVADKLNSGDSGKYVINQLVGLATEAIVMAHLEPNTPYDFLAGQTPSQVGQTRKQQKQAFRELAANFAAASPNMSEAEQLIYLKRSQIYGEIEAMKWAIQQHPPVAPAK